MTLNSHVTHLQDRDDDDVDEDWNHMDAVPVSGGLGFFSLGTGIGRSPSGPACATDNFDEDEMVGCYEKEAPRPAAGDSVGAKKNRLQMGISRYYFCFRVICAST